MRNAAYLAAIVLAIGGGSHFAFQLERFGGKGFLFWLLAPTVVIAILGAVRAKRDGDLYRSSSFDDGGHGTGWLNVRRGDFSRGFASAGILFVLAYGATKQLGPAHEAWLMRLYVQFGDTSDLRKNVGLVVGCIVVLAVSSEIVWRGLVPMLLAEQVGSRRAWVWAAVLYAVSLLPTAWSLRVGDSGLNPILPVSALVGGLLWGYMARRFERLWPGIFAHALLAWTVLMMFRLWGQSI